MIPPNSQSAVARADVTLGLSTPAFARMIAGSPVLTNRGLEMLDQREQALGGAIAAEMGSGTRSPGPATYTSAPASIRQANPARPECRAAKHYGSRTPHRIQLKRPTGSLMSSPRFRTAMARMHGKEPW